MAGPLDAGRRIARLIGAADNAPGVIRAYHGSPHSFSRFDASKIGTGEGAQSFGHGLYFAGNESVARSYRDALERMVMPQTPEEMASDYLRTWHRPDAARQMAETHLQDAASYRIPDERQALIRAAIDLMDSGQAQVLGPRGHMYEVEIGYPEEALLDLDAPVGEQPIAIQDALGSYGRAPWHFTFGQENWRGSNALSRIKDNLSGSAPEAARTLLGSGIPGVRYLDQGSRAAGEGSRNYVMFPGTEDRIRILRQYGLLPPLAGGLALQEEE